jgi:hypothetical protein
MPFTMIRAAAAISMGAAATLAVSLAVGPSLASGDGTHDWPRFGFDAAGSNASTAPAGITAADLPKLHMQRIQLPGTVDASAIYLHAVTVRGAPHDVFFVTTSYGITLAIDADSGTILWQHQPDGYDKWARTRQVTTATPVADPDRSFIYAVNPGGEIEKLAVADGRAEWAISITRNPQREKIASALNFSGGRVVAVTGGYIGDASPYQGHVALIDAASGHLVSAWNSLCSDRAGLIDPSTCAHSGSAIWGRTGAVIDSTGHIFVATGNGRWDGAIDWGDAVIELDPGATRMLGSYTPTTTAELESADLDLGSTSPVLLGDYVVQGGKDAMIRLIDWKKMRSGVAHKGGESQSVRTASGKGMFTAPAVWRSGTVTWIFAADFGGTAAYTLVNGRLEQKWKNGNAGSSPVVAGGSLYVYDTESHLRVYEPATGAVLATLDCGQGHWNSPIVVDGRIALPEGSSNSRVASGTMVIWRVR